MAQEPVLDIPPGWKIYQDDPEPECDPSVFFYLCAAVKGEKFLSTDSVLLRARYLEASGNWKLASKMFLWQLEGKPGFLPDPKKYADYLLVMPKTILFDCNSRRRMPAFFCHAGKWRLYFAYLDGAYFGRKVLLAMKEEVC